MMFRRGEIVDVPFLFTDLTQVKRRPALVVGGELGPADEPSSAVVVSDPSHRLYDDVVVAMISSTPSVGAVGNVSCVQIPLGSNLARGTNLKTDSTVFAGTLATIASDKVLGRRGFFSYMNLVDDALRAALSL